MLAQKPPKEFKVDFKDSAVILGDEVKIQSIVNNIVENALRYCDKDGEISVNWFIDKAGGHLSIKDNGIGMEEKHLNRITERFYELTKDGQENWVVRALDWPLSNMHCKHMKQHSRSRVSLGSVANSFATFQSHESRLSNKQLNCNKTVTNET